MRVVRVVHVSSIEENRRRRGSAGSEGKREASVRRRGVFDARWMARQYEATYGKHTQAI